jgi:hydrogenase expression/formation protein HypD
LSRPVKILNVCGGHERSISAAGLRAALPPQIELIPGPGCPVCICPEEDIHEAIQIARHEAVTLVAYGDMLRVPVNAPKSEPRSLEQAKAAGADVRAIASPLEAAKIARDNPSRKVVFLAAGFETTTAPAAALLAQGAPENLLFLMSGRRTWPAVALLLDSGEPGFEALIAPGHVSTVMGPEEWEFVPRDHDLPTAIAGFSPDSLLAALYSVLRQKIEGKCFLDNCYPQVVRPGGNATARRFIDETMDVVDGNWRGIGPIPQSGYVLKAAYAAHDSRTRLPSYTETARKRAGEMPPGCDCAKVVLGKIYPNECRSRLACTPRHPIGPCCVDEGAAASAADGVRENVGWAEGIRPRSDTSDRGSPDGS